MHVKNITAGETAAWADTPNHSLVRWLWSGHGFEFYWKRHNFVASLVGMCDGKWRGPGDDNGSFAPDESVTIIALDVPADATADDLRALAEVFEVRQALRLGSCVRLVTTEAERSGYESALSSVAERLHAAGWRPGMTAEDAARLLAEAG